MSIYTKTGDTGETSLLGGSRVKKDCREIEAIGEIDELNGIVGMLIARLPEGIGPVVKEKLTTIQHRLFTVGSNIAAVQTTIISVPRLSSTDVLELEEWIDLMEKDLPPLTQFILPGGDPSAADSFFARAVCRRAERATIAVKNAYLSLDPAIIQYLNRLSDALFVLGRWINTSQHVSDIVWRKSAS